ncbi:metal ABC transporter substrate-binding protein [Neotabrizicola shimadae]|uniref:Metal ABC transporter substrate-binding protein n=1 Tax=Neotabrizicola shimadae TaxID=2807096 RepID=A0A8G0ZNE2_9RHOB|nr:metal ABC transporter substrate-binding protein [Neotabrizicola shimadae]QYZ68551.1 metal ABC transporter substrate-binding protein [Neotabrizicola shimadae]
MLTRRLLLASAAAIAFAAPAFAQDKLNVIATFSILGDIVQNVGGDRVEVTTLVGPDGDAHVFQPAPADAQAVAGADVIVANGLGFEGWMDRLVEASGTKATIITASEGVTPRAFEEEGHDHAEGEDHDHAEEEAGHDHDHGGQDPHAWQSVANVEIYVGNIERGLTAADPEGAETYKANAAAYMAELQAVDAEIKAAIAALPEDRRTIVTSHDAFGYFGDAYGMTFKAPQGISTESEASAADVAALITQIRDEKIPAVFMENISDPRLLDQIAAETGAKVGGTLYSDALSGPEGPAGTYLTMMRYNIGQLTAALGQ